ncbi:MAG: hypothetical protein M3Z04_09190 [Chloroflexota bacterium]|nr:hypothetical protein [Chloroflexota bacterium]
MRFERITIFAGAGLLLVLAVVAVLWSSPGSRSTGSLISTSAPRRCPTPLHPSEGKPLPLPLPSTAQDTQTQSGNENDSTFRDFGAAYVQRITQFHTTATVQEVQAFYTARLSPDGWQSDPVHSSANSLRFTWMVNIHAWIDPPCAVTPENGLPVYLLQVLITELSTGEREVTVQEGIALGF